MVKVPSIFLLNRNYKQTHWFYF